MMDTGPVIEKDSETALVLAESFPSMLSGHTILNGLRSM